MADSRNGLTPRDSRNLSFFSIWTMAATTTFVVGTIIIKTRVVDSKALMWVLAVLTLVLSLAAFRRYLLFLRNADELLRRIQLEGLALGFGAGAVFMLCYRLFERLGAPKLDSSDPFVVMAAFWIIGLYSGLRRYGAAEAS